MGNAEVQGCRLGDPCCSSILKAVNCDVRCFRRTMVSQLIWHERVETTVPRAKELRKIADRMVTLGKEVRVLICDVCCLIGLQQGLCMPGESLFGRPIQWLSSI